MKKFKLLDICLTLFDGSGDGAGAAASAGAESTAQGETQAAPGSTRPGNSKETILYGKQPEAAAPDHGAEGKSRDTASGEDRRKAFRSLMEGEYKDLYQEATQRIVNDAFKRTKENETALQQQLGQYQALADLLAERYGVTDGDVGKLTAAVENDREYLIKAAEEAGMDPDTFRDYQRVKRENAQLMRAEQNRKGQEFANRRLMEWDRQAQEARLVYPDLDLQTEVKDPNFLSLLRSGVPVQKAYEVIHMDAILSRNQAETARETEKKITDNIRAKGSRPPENGSSSARSAFTVRDDVSKLTKKDRAEIARQAERGAKITF